MGEFILQAINNTGDPMFITALREYKEKMNNQVQLAKNKGQNPISYSRSLAYANLADEIVINLQKGGN